jgi:hypothetical protein
VKCSSSTRCDEIRGGCSGEAPGNGAAKTRAQERFASSSARLASAKWSGKVSGITDDGQYIWNGPKLCEEGTKWEILGLIGESLAKKILAAEFIFHLHPLFSSATPTASHLHRTSFEHRRVRGQSPDPLHIRRRGARRN